jgi:hypothetical protein
MVSIRLCVRSVVALAGLLVISESAWAQALYPNARRPPPPQHPTTSPYLNLLRRQNSTAFNYYTLVRPEVQIRNQLAQQGAAIYQLRGDLQAQENANTTSQMQPTGHATTFLNTSRYYPGGPSGTGRR